MPWPLKLREIPDNKWPHKEQVGDVFKQVHELMNGEKETHWYVVLPNGALFDIYGKMSDGSPGWTITGEFPNITAHPSINSHAHSSVQGWHGYITNGVMSDDLEGRTYP